MNNLWILIPLILGAWFAVSVLAALLIAPFLAAGTRYDLKTASAARQEASGDQH